jgi:hypothetical protein
MLTTSHAFFTYAATPAGGPALLAVAGSVLPDLPFWVGTPWHALRGAPGLRAALRATETGPVAGTCARAAHSILVWAVAALALWALAPALLPLVWAWLGHLGVDFFTHHTDAHPHFYPLSEWRFASPVSYHEWDHHAREYLIVEGLATAAVLASWVGAGRIVGVLHALALPLLFAALAAALVALAGRLRGFREEA